MNKIIEEKAYAKVNFTLDIKSRREDGYHELESIMVPITLYDKLTFELSESEDILINMSTGNIELEKNIIYKTITLMKERYLINNGIKVSVEKNIPVEAGLAGGSADCAATIKAVNRLFELELEQHQMIEIANTLGSDTAFCVFGKPAIVTGRGDHLEEIECNFNHMFYIIKPNFGMSTKEIFRNHKLVESTEATDFVKKALANNDKDLLTENWFNDLEKTVYDISDDMKRIRDNLMMVTNKSLMSGSGSSIIVFCDNENQINQFSKKYNCQLISTKIKKC